MASQYRAVLVAVALAGLWGAWGQPINQTYSVPRSGLVDVLRENYYTNPISMGNLRAQCTMGAPAYPVEELTIDGAHKAFLSGSLTCTQLVMAYLERISSYDRLTINAIRTVHPDAMAEAAAKDVQLKNYLSNGTGSLPPMFCVPAIFKDNHDTLHTATTASAVALLDNFPYKDSDIARRFKAAGGIVLAKGNLAEWASSAGGAGGMSVGSIHGVVRNAYGLDRSSDGSSGGPGAATAANFGLVSFGSDTGSSIRSPASHNSLVGHRPTLGLVSRTGIVPLNLNRDTGGPLTRTVTDTAKIMDVIAGFESSDTLTALVANITTFNFTAGLVPGALKGKRLGVARSFYTKPGADPVVLAIMDQAILDLQAAGATIVDNFTIGFNPIGSLPWNPSNTENWGVGYGNNSRYESTGGPCNVFKPDLDLYLATAGTKYKSTADIYYDGGIHPVVESSFVSTLTKSAQTRENFPPPGSKAVCNCKALADNPCVVAYQQAFVASLDNQTLDAVIYPTFSTSPQLIGNIISSGPGVNHVQNSGLAPTLGAPAITVPMGYDKIGLPAGLQIMGRPLDDALVISIAFGYEQATKWRRPSGLFPECTSSPRAYTPLATLESAVAAAASRVVSA